jgi:hypothetical protein
MYLHNGVGGGGSKTDMNTDNVNKPFDDRCHYCTEPGIYWDQVGATIISVCKKHMKNYYAS